MLLLDITKHLKKAYPNSYVFNPSIIHASADLYLVSYRICKYNSDRVFHNPWKVWDNDYKIFSGPQQVKSLKFRDNDYLEPEFCISLNSKGLISDYNVDEYDSTSIALVRITELFSVETLYNLECPFGSRMNQDARLFEQGGVKNIVYNVYCRDGSIRLLQRTVDFNAESFDLSFGPERPMFDHCYKMVEKNCSSSSMGHVLYSIGTTFDVILAKNNIIKKPCPLAELIEYYGEDNVHCSVSTPAIRYRNRFVSCGHIKLLYKQIKKEPFLSFVSKFKFMHQKGNIHPHGKYIYFAFFFEFDKNYNITRYSNLFIPTLFSDYIPYLLVMPTGLIYVKDKICMSYGEGDSKCKLLMLTRGDMENLLERFGGASISQPYFLTQKIHIHHIGYFGFFNTGDDAFVKVFEYLRDKYYSSATLEFLKPRQKERKPAHLTILGGGDVLTTYFLNYPYKSNSVAVGIGIPYKEFEKEVNRFRHCIIRNTADYKGALQYNQNVSHHPDICFLLPKIYTQDVVPISGRIGVSILRTYFNANFPKVYQDYVEKTAQWIDIVLRKDPNVEIWLVPFGINSTKVKENDILAARDILSRVQLLHRVHILDVDPHNNVEDIFTFIKSLSFMVCARFHSHIFSAAAKVPFVSLTCGHKCITFMEQNGLSEYMYLLPKDELDLPLALDEYRIAEFILKNWQAARTIKKVVDELYLDHMQRIEVFEAKYLEILRDCVEEGEVTLQ